METRAVLLSLLALLLLVLGGCGAPTAEGKSAPAGLPRHEFTLRTGIVDGRIVFVGVGGAIDGKVNPDLAVQAGATVHIEVVNDDGMTHDLALPDLHVQTAPATGRGSTVAVTFTANESGTYAYICTVAGHRQAGMEGRLIVAPGA
jgi:nitrite reductase (NO-forming)